MKVPAFISIRTAIFSLLVLFVFPASAMSTTLTSNTSWSGKILVEQDILVPEGVTLRVAPGTIIRVAASDSTKTDPDFISSQTEIIVRGTIVVDAKAEAPVVFKGTDEKRATWAGIIIDGGKATIHAATISDAETGVTVLKGVLAMSGSLLRKNRYGMVLHGPDAVAQARGNRLEENEYGLLLLNGARIDSKDNIVANNRKKDSYVSAVKGRRPALKEYKPAKIEKSRIYGDEVLSGTTVWQGRIEVRGIIRVPEKSRLIILPGTIVEFSRKDTNHDGIGKNGLMIQGVITAKGAKESPIVFRSAEKRPAMGDWDSINIMNSDSAHNLIEYCQIEDAYRGLHFHFSNVTVASVVVRNNYRGIQFQESVVDITKTYFYGNKSAFQARDSEILFTDNVVAGNYTGMNIFRDTISIRGNVIANNCLEGLRIREGLPVVEGNLLEGNRHGLMVSDAVYGTFSRNVMIRNLETGLSLRATDAIDVSGNVIQANGVNGISIQDSSASISGNLISDNGERGIGVQSFQGVITGNNILRNGLYNLGIDGPTDVAARMNWWGAGDIRRTIYDKENDPSKGRAEYQPLLEHGVTVAWPLKTVPSSAAWHGDIGVSEVTTVEPGVELVVSPGTRVLFSKKSGLVVKGRIVARGEKNLAIVFTAADPKGAGDWDEIILDHATGSVFANCIFENGTWALHSHFTDLKVDGCVFRSNLGGLRFTSGPIEVRHSLFEKNEIGIRAFRGSAVIADNVITANTSGIFVREKGGGLTITRNNLFGNVDYNIRNGDFNDQDVDAKDNWWGNPVPTVKIYDARVEPGIGMVQYEPSAARPFSITIPVSGAGQAQ